ncbi:hypothetical protein AAFF_G00422850 [Aldrovandia affinis]|uniref:Uncharacterized protein n=1 Tax=Aldrovandia affinis TaxID=143900 RepID=A0AAD7X013_9TELE|nr:hypothetical protein AAFF_G00422850 [Aldrovandia affinis]
MELDSSTREQAATHSIGYAAHDSFDSTESDQGERADAFQLTSVLDSSCFPLTAASTSEVGAVQPQTGLPTRPAFLKSQSDGKSQASSDLSNSAFLWVSSEATLLWRVKHATHLRMVFPCVGVDNDVIEVLRGILPKGLQRWLHLT